MDNPAFLRLLEEFGHRWFRSAENQQFDLAVEFLMRAYGTGRELGGNFSNDEAERDTATRRSLVSVEDHVLRLNAERQVDPLASCLPGVHGQSAFRVKILPFE